MCIFSNYFYFRSRQKITYPFGLPFCSLAASLLNYRTKAMRIRRSLPGNKIAKPTDQFISCRLLRSRQKITYPFGLPFCSLAASLLNYRTKAMRIRRSLPGNKIAKPTDQFIFCRLLRSRQKITYPFGLPFCSLAASLLNYRTKAMRIRRSLPGNKIAKPTDQFISCRLLRSRQKMVGSMPNNLFSANSNCKFTTAAMLAMFTEINPLPGSEIEPSVSDGDDYRAS